MRWWMLAAIAMATVSCWSACAPKPAVAMAGDGELVIECGGSHRSLAASLHGLGVELLPPHALEQAPGAPRSEPSSEPAAEPAAAPTADAPGGSPPEPAPQDGGDASSGPERRSAKEQPPARQPGPAFVEVVLQPRQTLIDLARQHLGSGARFKEILQCNGWSEADARRLKAGQKVRIPAATKS